MRMASVRRAMKFSQDRYDDQCALWNGTRHDGEIRLRSCYLRRTVVTAWKNLTLRSNRRPSSADGWVTSIKLCCTHLFLAGLSNRLLLLSVPQYLQGVEPTALPLSLRHLAR